MLELGLLAEWLLQGLGELLALFLRLSYLMVLLNLDLLLLGIRRLLFL